MASRAAVAAAAAPLSVSLWWPHLLPQTLHGLLVAICLRLVFCSFFYVLVELDLPILNHLGVQSGEQLLTEHTRSFIAALCE